MKNPFLTLLLTISMIFVSCAAFKPKTRQEVIATTELSLLRISHDIDGKHEFTCTGFIINSAKGQGITAKHCVVNDDGSPVETLLVNGFPTEIIKTSETLALIKVNVMLGPPLDLRKDLPNKGEDVIGLGYGFGDYVVMVRHIGNPKPGFGGKQDIVLDGPLAPGMSGGPVVDMDGKVVGLAQQNSPFYILSLLCGSDEIRDFLKSK